MVKIHGFAFLLLVLLSSRFGAPEAALRHLRHVLENNAIPEAERWIHECENSDYRAYIKCLKREKRQHQHLDGSKDGCLDECLNRACINSTCLRDCHSKCKSRRLIETHIQTVETNLDCQNGDCQRNNGGTPNITTNIHIENILPNVTGPATGGGGGGGGGGNNPSNPPFDPNHPGPNGTTYIVPKVDINNVINNQFGFPGGPFSPGGGPCMPGSWNCGYQPLPQITIGFGGGPVGGGCMFPWPCLQKNPNEVDCSPCGNPFLRYQCDVRCYPDPQNVKNNTQNSTTQKPPPPQSSSRINSRYP